MFQIHVNLKKEGGWSFYCGEWQIMPGFLTNETRIIFFIKLPTQNEQKKCFHNKNQAAMDFILLKLSNLCCLFDMVTVGQRGHLNVLLAFKLDFSVDIENDFLSFFHYN